VKYLFDEYIFRAAIGETEWKNRIQGGDMRHGSIMAEVFALATLNNGYMVWLYKWKTRYPHSTLRTEYDVVEEGGEGVGAVPRLFCADLELVEVSVPTALPDLATDAASTAATEGTQEAGNGDFALLLPLAGGVESDEKKAAREHDEDITKSIKERIDADRAGTSRPPTTRLLDYNKMCTVALQDRQKTREAMTGREKKEASKMVNASKASLRPYTNGSRKSKRGSSEVKGWNRQGKVFCTRMMSRIKREETFGGDGGIRKKWETMYKKMHKISTKGGEAGGDDEDDEEVEVDEELMYEGLVAGV